MTTRAADGSPTITKRESGRPSSAPPRWRFRPLRLPLAGACSSMMSTAMLASSQILLIAKSSAHKQWPAPESRPRFFANALSSSSVCGAWWPLSHAKSSTPASVHLIKREYLVREAVGDQVARSPSVGEHRQSWSLRQQLVNAVVVAVATGTTLPSRTGEPGGGAERVVAHD